MFDRTELLCKNNGRAVLKHRRPKRIDVVKPSTHLQVILTSRSADEKTGTYFQRARFATEERHPDRLRAVYFSGATNRRVAMANRRQGIGDGLRFEIFKRDGFQCQYCGRIPPEAVLAVDHIRPVADGGTNDSINLVTSCRECNSGKSDQKLHALPPSIDEIISNQAETIAQLTAYNEFLRQAHKIELQSVDDVVRYFEDGTGCSLQTQDIASIKQFFRKLGYRELIDAVDAAVARYGDASFSRLWRYFCGVCWNKVRDKQDAECDKFDQ